MPEQIKSIHIKRFRKFKENTLLPSQHNVLVGANNSGKTSVLHALRLFFLSLSGEFSGTANKVVFHKRYINVGDILHVADAAELWTDREKGQAKTTGIIIEIGFQSGLRVESVFTYRFGQVHVDATVTANPQNRTGAQINDVMNHKLVFIPGLVGILPQEAYVTPARRSAMLIEARYSEMYRSSLLHLDTSDKKALKAINSILKSHLGVEITAIKFDPEKDVYVDVKYSQNGIHLDLASAGSGMLQIIQLLVYIYLHNPTLLLIDEPDAHLHPELQEKLGAVLKKVTQDMNAQLFVASHSPDVIDAFSSQEVFFINAEKKKLVSFKNDADFVTGLVEAGIVTNSSLSRIAVRPKCLVIEDAQISTFKTFDSVLGTNLFNFAGDYKQAKGVSKFQNIHEVYLAVQGVVGKKIPMFFVQDRDGLPDRYINYIMTKYQQQNMTVEILKRHEIENYLLDGKIIRAALADKGKDVSLKECRKLLIAAAETIKAVARGDIRRKAKQVNHFCSKPDNMDDNAVEAEVDQWFDNLTMNETTVLSVYPGKELIKTVLAKISTDYIVDVRESDLRNVITRMRIGADLRQILERIAQHKKV
ncbi:MAG: ATP-binding protein [Deltaproteobacteria bacterium]|nr:ATP-binding protein [Deltaproteobacteria bacterium]